MHHLEPIQLYTFDEIRAVLKLSRSGLYRQIKKDPTFPRPRKDGTARSCRVYFFGHEIAAWQLSRAADSVRNGDVSSRGSSLIMAGDDNEVTV